MAIALVFPGQGSQREYMGRELAGKFPEAREVFHKADETLGFSLSELCFAGAQETLNLTESSQLAILTVSTAAFRVFRERYRGMSFNFLAGHSLGEYSALVAAAAFSFSDALRLVQKRALFMKEASSKVDGGMCAVIGLGIERVEELCKNVSGEVQIANINSPTQIVISGEQGPLRKVSGEALLAGAKKVLPLSVGGPFHSRFMEAAAEKLAKELNKMEIKAPSFPIVSSVTARDTKVAQEIRKNLTMQLCQPVRWDESVKFMTSAGVDTFIELGPGRVLTKLIHRTDKNLRVYNVEDEESIEGVSRDAA